MKTNYQIEIILKLKKIRQEQNYSQENIANLLGISNGHIGNIESPKTSHKYTLSQINVLCNEFKIPIEHIFLNDEDYTHNIDIVSKIVQKNSSI